MAYLLDTNTVSYFIKGRPIRVHERLVRVPMEELTISVITEAELLFGVVRHPQASRLNQLVHEFLIRVRVLPWNSDTAKSYATVREELERKGTPIGDLDLLIAAQALAANAILVSSDPVFRHIRRLQIEDWTKA